MTIFFLCLLLIRAWQCNTQDLSQTDSSLPAIINCPEDFEIIADASQPLGFATWTEPSVLDTSGRTHRVYRSYRPNSMLPVGENEIIYVFADENDKRATCSFKILVKSVDTNPPIVYNCPNEITSSVEIGSEHAVVEWSEPAAMDDSGTVVLKERTHFPGQLFPVSPSKHMVRYVYTDSSMNEGYCTFNVIINKVDTTSPQIISCPNIVTREVELHSNGSYVEWTNPTATDNSGNVNLISMSHSRGDFFPLGITKVEYIFGDDSGNTAICNIDVVVTEVDRMVPKILHCPNDIIAGVKAPLTTTTSVHWTEPTASDNSGKALMTGRSNAPGSEFELGTSTEVIYQFSDQSGNTAYCSFDVRVINDTTKPSIIGCPTRIIRQVNRSEKGMRVTWEEPIASDDTAYVEKMFNTHSSGDFFYVGSTGVEYVFKDLAGNTEECSFEVQITYVAEAVTGDNNENSHSVSGIDPHHINRMIMVIPITAGTIIVLVSLIVVIGVYRIKRINHAREAEKVALKDDEGIQLPTDPPYFVLSPEEYASLQHRDEYLHPKLPTRKKTLPINKAMQDQARSMAGHLNGDVWMENRKYRNNGAFNRAKSRKHQLPTSNEETAGDPSYMTMRKAKSKKKLEIESASAQEKLQKGLLKVTTSQEAELSPASSSYVDMEVGESDSADEYHGISDGEDSMDV